MSEMDRARETQKVLGQSVYEGMGASERNGYYSVLIDKKGLCSEYALTACSLAESLGRTMILIGQHQTMYIFNN